MQAAESWSAAPGHMVSLSWQGTSVQRTDTYQPIHMRTRSRRNQLTGPKLHRNRLSSHSTWSSCFTMWNPAWEAIVMEQEAGGQARGYKLPGNLQAARGPFHSMVLDSRCSLTALRVGQGQVVWCKPWVKLAPGVVLINTQIRITPALRSMLLKQVCQQHCSPPPDVDCSSVSTACT